MRNVTLCVLTAALAAACSNNSASETPIVGTNGEQSNNSYAESNVPVSTDWQTLRRHNLGVYRVAGTDKRVVVGENPQTGQPTVSFYAPVFTEPQAPAPVAPTEPATQFPGRTSAVPVPVAPAQTPCIPENARSYFTVRQRAGGSGFAFLDTRNGTTYVADRTNACGYKAKILDP